MEPLPFESGMGRVACLHERRWQNASMEPLPFESGMGTRRFVSYTRPGLKPGATQDEVPRSGDFEGAF